MTTEGTQFEILNRVDVGGMAEIFRAKNLSTGEIMAIKRILPSLAGQANFVNMFIDEAAVCMALRHPNIVRVDQIGLMDDALFLSMEFVDGMNLRDLLNFANQYKFKLPIHEAVRIAALILDGLEYAHHVTGENGEPLNLIHRDISPPNILLGYNGDVKITDFGLVKSKSQLSKTVPGLIKGKFSYLSPEAAYGESIDHRSDLYAVGIILWEMLASRPLFNDPIETKILDLVRKSIVPPITSINDDVPDALEKIINKGLARSRADRYQTAHEFAEDLRGFLKSMGDPESTLGDIVAKIKPPQVPDDEEETAEVPENATAADDEVQPHTRSELIPIEALVKAADEAEREEDEQKEKAAQEKAEAQRVAEEAVPKTMFDKWNSLPDAMKKKYIIIAAAIALIVILGIAFSVHLFS
ncbi:MAG: serine/threonine protein kinase [Proteobacteria bacterium]|nr:serine/threonine protein kinase [Pseudomonadota bacterium]